MSNHAMSPCPKCGKPKEKRSQRCAECYAKEMYAVGNAPVSAPVFIPETGPLEVWHGGAGTTRSAPAWCRWRMTEYGEWVAADSDGGEVMEA